MVTKRSTRRIADRAEHAELTVSSKRQITLPAAMARELGVEPGHKLIARVDGGRIVLKPSPHGLMEVLEAFPQGTYGRTKEEIDAYINDVRRGWDRRARMTEGDAHVPKDDPRFDR